MYIYLNIQALAKLKICDTLTHGLTLTLNRRYGVSTRNESDGRMFEIATLWHDMYGESYEKAQMRIRPSHFVLD